MTDAAPTGRLGVRSMAALPSQLRRRYTAVWRAHVYPQLGDQALRELRPEAIERFERELADAGVDPASIRVASAMLKTVFAEASAGPVAGAPDAADAGRSLARALKPREVERLRARLDARDGVIVSLLAYAGLRPGELLNLRWRDVGHREISVDGGAAAVRRHTRVPATRQVELLRPLAGDLAGWRDQGHARAGSDERVVPPATGRSWDDGSWSRWRRERFEPAAKAAGLPSGVRPYDLRRTFAWLLLREGATVLDLARQTGYSELTALRIYRALAQQADAAGHRLAPEEIAVARAA